MRCFNYVKTANGFSDGLLPHGNIQRDAAGEKRFRKTPLPP
ncbi:hypothetical protein HMPREF9120_02153 [Neisseria sp. oral taxon 020 str. F0370]|nr:hypothetical protein HMPREF9120_02153 [Neisseria sp. oral taxon 020 str. F0370]